jgi:hypothetical protein
MPRAVASLPPPANNPPGLRGSTIIAAPAPDGLQDAGLRRAPRRTEEDPWAPVGLRLGTITVLPAITQSLGYDSNPNRTSGPARGSAVSRTEGEIGLRSDWSTHRFTANLRAGYSAFPNQRDANRPDGAANAALQLNLGRDTDLDFDMRAGLDTQRPGSTNFNFAVRERPNIYTAGVGAALTQRFNRLSLSLRGTVDRTTYEDATDLGGNRIRQSDRDLTQYGLRLRAGYEVMPGVTPFVETLADQRVFDERADQSGFRRDSRSLALRAGSTFELTRLITGEVAVGYQSRDFEDPRLKTLAGVVGEASLSWAVTPLTTVSLRAATDLNDTTIAGSSGSVNRRLGLEVAHALRRNWTVTGFATLNRNDFDRTNLTEDVWQMGLRTEYRLTRMVALRASFTHERLVSSAPRSDYTANTVLVGLRLQL